MKLIFPLRDFECSAKMCDSLFHCDCTEGILADVHSLFLLYIFTLLLCLMPELTLQNNSACVSVVFIQNETDIAFSIPLSNMLSFTKALKF